MKNSKEKGQIYSQEGKPGTDYSHTRPSGGSHLLTCGLDFSPVQRNEIIVDITTRAVSALAAAAN